MDVQVKDPESGAQPVGGRPLKAFYLFIICLTAILAAMQGFWLHVPLMRILAFLLGILFYSCLMTKIAQASEEAQRPSKFLQFLARLRRYIADERTPSRL